MSFIASYKHLEKLCRELLSDDRGVAAYIDEMKQIPDASRYVKGWDTDLKKLNHYRWMRNKISHDPDYTEENTCSPEDEKWVDEFYMRIIHQTDPLALQHNASSKATQRPPIRTNEFSDHISKKKSSKDTKNLIITLVIAFVALLITLGALFTIN